MSQNADQWREEQDRLRERWGRVQDCTVEGHCEEYEQIWDCDRYREERDHCDRYKKERSCDDWIWGLGWICVLWVWVETSTCEVWVYVTTTVCEVGQWVQTNVCRVGAWTT